MKTSTPLYRSVSIILILFFCFAITETFLASSINDTHIFYVKPGGTGDCSSWAQACELQTALTSAVSGDQIWVAAGTYKPTTTTHRNISFVLKSGVAIYGGFPAEGGDWSSRDWETNTTTLSGDIGTEGDNNDNTYHVISASNVDNTAVLDGFNVTAGNALDESYNSRGGGMNFSLSSPSIRNIKLTNNIADYGGGMHNLDSSPSLINVSFSDNTARYTGGGMANNNSSPTLTNVTFSSNTASIITGYGGGMWNYNNSNAILDNVSFSSNHADSFGGGMYNESSSPSLTNVTFSGNIATWEGGGMYNENGNPVLTNVTMVNNTSGSGGGIFSNAGITITSSILWGNTPNQVNGESSIITYSDVQGGFSGEGNINLDPLLGPLDDNGGFTQTHALLSGSPAIDSGNPDVCPPHDQRFFTRPVDGDNNGTTICDMGAYEYNATPITYAINITIEGYGNVTKNPDKTSYHYGDVVELTANANPGWTFSHWSGDAIGSTNPLSFFIIHDINITAHFTQNEYTLSVSVDPEDSGTVSLDPQQDTYHYGEVVTLTAMPAPGWSFASWTGDASGTTNPVEITITGNTSVTAHFTQNEYTLSVTFDPENSGTVSLDPQQDTYYYGDVVELTATPALGWSFANWTGDASGTTNPVEITITKNTSVVAHFTQNEYTLTVTVDPENSGTVSLDPDQDTYHYGDVVELTATPELGWSFATWSGDASGSDNPLTITILGNTEIIANFQKFWLYLPLILR